MYKLAPVLILFVLASCADHPVRETDKDSSGRFDGIWKGHVFHTEPGQRRGQYHFKCRHHERFITMEIIAGVVHVRSPADLRGKTFIDQAGRFRLIIETGMSVSTVLSSAHPTMEVVLELRGNLASSLSGELTIGYDRINGVGCGSEITFSKQRNPSTQDTFDADYLEALNRHVSQAVEQAYRGSSDDHNAQLINPLMFGTALLETFKYDFEHEKRFDGLRDTILGNARTVFSETTLENSREAARILEETFFDEFRAYGVFPNPMIAAGDSGFLFRCTGEEALPNRAAMQSLRALFGRPARREQLKVLVTEGPDSSVAGLTMVEMAIVHMPGVRIIADTLRVDPDLIKAVVVANEAAHLQLNQRHAIRPVSWPRDTVRKLLGLSFSPSELQIEEFLSDAASTNTGPAGGFVQMLRIFDGSLRKDGSINTSHRYAASTEFFLNALDQAEQALGVTAARRRVDRLRRLYGRMDTDDVRDEFERLFPTEHEIRFFTEQYLAAGKAVLALLDETSRSG